MNVWTGDVFIEIFTHGISGGAQSVADALVSLNNRGPASPDEPLPPISVEC